MRLDIDPPPSERELAALRRALAGSGLLLEDTPPEYSSGWWRSAVREAVENEPRPPRYALSPRSTRGARRA